MRAKAPESERDPFQILRPITTSYAPSASPPQRVIGSCRIPRETGADEAVSDSVAWVLSLFLRLRISPPDGSFPCVCVQGAAVVYLFFIFTFIIIFFLGRGEFEGGGREREGGITGAVVRC